MSAAKSTLVIGGSAIGGVGGTGAAGYGIHKATEKTIGDFFQDDLLPTEESKNKEEWKKLEKRLNDNKNQESQYGLSGYTSENNDGNKLVEWCKLQKDVSYGSIIYHDYQYVSKVKTYCIYTVKEKLSENTGIEILNTEDKVIEADFKGSFDKMLSLSTDNNTNGNIKSVPSLDNLQSTYKNKDQDWPHLKDWCRWALMKGFREENSDHFKLTKHLCTKNKTVSPGN